MDGNYSKVSSSCHSNLNPNPKCKYSGRLRAGVGRPGPEHPRAGNGREGDTVGCGGDKNAQPEVTGYVGAVSDFTASDPGRKPENLGN